jgi:hypothetical protein
MDPRIRIHTKMSWIHNNDFEEDLKREAVFQTLFSLSPTATAQSCRGGVLTDSCWRHPNRRDLPSPDEYQTAAALILSLS